MAIFDPKIQRELTREIQLLIDIVSSNQREFRQGSMEVRNTFRQFEELSEKLKEISEVIEPGEIQSYFRDYKKAHGEYSRQVLRNAEIVRKQDEKLKKVKEDSIEFEKRITDEKRSHERDISRQNMEFFKKKKELQLKNEMDIIRDKQKHERIDRENARSVKEEILKLKRDAVISEIRDRAELQKRINQLEIQYILKRISQDELSNRDDLVSKFFKQPSMEDDNRDNSSIKDNVIFDSRFNTNQQLIQRIEALADSLDTNSDDDSILDKTDEILYAVIDDNFSEFNKLLSSIRNSIDGSSRFLKTPLLRIIDVNSNILDKISRGSSNENFRNDDPVRSVDTGSDINSFINSINYIIEEIRQSDDRDPYQIIRDLFKGSDDGNNDNGGMGSESGSQDEEQYANILLENIVQQTSLLDDILKAIGDDSGDEGGGKDDKSSDIFAWIAAIFKKSPIGKVFGGITSLMLAKLVLFRDNVKKVFKNIFSVRGIKSLFGKIGSSITKFFSMIKKIPFGKIFGGISKLAKPLLKAAGPIYAIFKGISETFKQFESTGSIVGDVFERIRLLSRNILIAIPKEILGGIDAITSALFGFTFELEKIPDKIFDVIEELSSFIGSKLHDLLYKENVDKVEETEQQLKARQDRLNTSFEVQRELMRQKKIKKQQQESREAEREQDDELDLTLKLVPSKISPKISKEIEKNIEDNIEKSEEDQTKTKKGPDLSLKLIPSTKKPSEKLPIRITSASDGKHRHGSKHYEGQALDLTPVGFGGLPYTGKPLRQENPEAYSAYRSIHKKLETMGLRVVDEYSQPKKTSKHGSARHIHVEGTQEEINQVLSRAQVVKRDVVPFKANEPMTTQVASRELKEAQDKPKRDTVQAISQQPVLFKPQVTTPPPTVILVNQDDDRSYKTWSSYKASR